MRCDFCNKDVVKKGHILPEPCSVCGGQIHVTDGMGECTCCGCKGTVNQIQVPAEPEAIV